MAGLEMKDFISNGVIAATATLCAVYITSRFNLKLAKLNIEAQNGQKERERKLAKLEELYHLFGIWEVSIVNVYLLHLRCYRNKLEFHQVLDLIKDGDNVTKNEAQRIKMLMHVHFPLLANSYELVDAARRKIVPFLSNPKESGLNADDFEIVQVAFERACEAFKSEISQLAQKV